MMRAFMPRLLYVPICLCISVPCVSLGKLDQSSSPLKGKPLFLESLQGSTRLRRDRQENIYVLNKRDSSILVYGRDFSFVRRIGSLGQGPEDLRNPNDFAVDAAGNVVVADTDNNAIKVFLQSGKLVYSFPLDKPYSVDTLSTGEILAVGGRENQLIQVLSRDGRALRYVGELASTIAADKSPALHRYLNRGVLFVDNHDNIFWAGGRLPVPLVRKYSSGGELLLEFQLGGPKIEALSSRARQRVEEQIRARTIGAIDTLHGIQVEEATGEIWVAPAAAGLLIYDSLGRFKGEVAMKAGPYDSVGAWDVMVLKRGRFIISNTVIGCYLFDLAESSNRKEGRRKK